MKVDEDDNNGKHEQWTEAISRVWTCPKCQQTSVLTAGERLKHESFCSVSKVQQKNDNVEKKEEDDAGTSSGEKDATAVHKRQFFCNICNKSLYLSSSEFLRHKMSHHA